MLICYQFHYCEALLLKVRNLAYTTIPLTALPLHLLIVSYTANVYITYIVSYNSTDPPFCYTS